MLGALLLRRPQLGLQTHVLGFVRSAPPRPGDRMHDHRAFLDANERLRRRADQGGRVRLEKEHVGRRIHVPERAIERQRIGTGTDVEALREHDLDAVSFGDQLTRAADAIFELGRRAVGRDRRRIAPRRGQRRQRRVERRVDPVDHLGRATRGRHVVVSQDRERVPQVVERDDGVVDAEDRIWHPKGCVGVVARERQTFEAAGRLIRDEAHSPAAESR